MTDKQRDTGRSHVLPWTAGSPPVRDRLIAVSCRNLSCVDNDTLETDVQLLPWDKGSSLQSPLRVAKFVLLTYSSHFMLLV